MGALFSAFWVYSRGGTNRQLESRRKERLRWLFKTPSLMWFGFNCSSTEHLSSSLIGLPSSSLQVLVTPFLCVCACARSVVQSCPTLCNPMDYSLLGSSVHGILQAKILEWVGIPFSRGSSQSRDWTWVTCIVRQILYHCPTWEASLLPRLPSLIKMMVKAPCLCCYPEKLHLPFVISLNFFTIL